MLKSNFDACYLLLDCETLAWISQSGSHIICVCMCYDVMRSYS